MSSNANAGLKAPPPKRPLSVDEVVVEVLTVGEAVSVGMVLLAGGGVLAAGGAVTVTVTEGALLLSALRLSVTLRLAV
jgi:hypothetical protein